ncbi:MAG: nitronate monooxygenase [Caulobacteraceae bacterium]|nr:nitronate monooxygenase [Caulobacteraceae bacterium]
MRNRLCEMTGAEFPLFAFSHCRDVVAAVSRAGGFGVLGGSSFSPESLEVELKWIDDHVNSKPYGVDIIIPENIPKEVRDSRAKDMTQLITREQKAFVTDLLADYGVSFDPDRDISAAVGGKLVSPEWNEALLDVAFSHPIRLIANALGLAPPMMIDRAKSHGVPVGALVGSSVHALRQVNAGVDFIVAQGTEAGGHCGEVSTLVLVTEVVRAIEPIAPIPVIAAGGVMTGRQMAAVMALGAQGAWTGTVWLVTTESNTPEFAQDIIVNAGSRDTLRAKSTTGKLCRQTRSAWHEAWLAPGAPPIPPMPLMSMLGAPAMRAVQRSVDGGNERARVLLGTICGQGIGLVEGMRSAGEIVQDFKRDFGEAVENLMVASDLADQ